MEIKYKPELAEKRPDLAEALDKLNELANKKHSDEYYQMQEMHHNTLVSLADIAKPWDWSYGTDLYLQHLYWMRDYYKLNENVWAQEDKEWKKGVKYTRLETIEKAISYIERMNSLEDEYIRVVKHGERKSHDNGDGTCTVDDLGFRCVYKYGSMKRTYKKLFKAKNKCKKLFFKTLYKYMESWWD